MRDGVLIELVSDTRTEIAMRAAFDRRRNLA
jgi:hypothetical protein